VIDHAYSAGPLSAILQNRKRASICYISHNAEGAIRPRIASSFNNPLRRTLMRLDAESIADWRTGFCRVQMLSRVSLPRMHPTSGGSRSTSTLLHQSILALSPLPVRSNPTALAHCYFWALLSGAPSKGTLN